MTFKHKCKPVLYRTPGALFFQSKTSANNSAKNEGKNCVKKVRRYVAENLGKISSDTKRSAVVKLILGSKTTLCLIFIIYSSTKMFFL